MSCLAILVWGLVGLLVTILMAKVWLKYHPVHLWWFIPPLTFITWMFSVYCFLTIAAYALGMPTEIGVTQ